MDEYQYTCFYSYCIQTYTDGTKTCLKLYIEKLSYRDKYMPFMPWLYVK